MIEDSYRRLVSVTVYQIFTNFWPRRSSVGVPNLLLFEKCEHRRSKREIILNKHSDCSVRSARASVRARIRANVRANVRALEHSINLFHSQNIKSERSAKKLTKPIAFSQFALDRL